jgi:hypothetical protein
MHRTGLVSTGVGNTQSAFALHVLAMQELPCDLGRVHLRTPQSYHNESHVVAAGLTLQSRQLAAETAA